jgi:hypothetical protein
MVKNFLEEMAKVKIKKTKPTKKLPQPKYDFVHQYTLVDPRYVTPDYDFWASWCFLPVACESEKDSAVCVKMDTRILMPFLTLLKNTPKKLLEKPEMRTVSVVDMKHGAKAYLFPNLDEASGGYKIIFTNARKSRMRLPLSCFTTPEINQAITAQAKIYRQK